MGDLWKLFIRATQKLVTLCNHDNAEARLFTKAFLDHIKIARFKNLQRQFPTRKQHQRHGQ